MDEEKRLISDFSHSELQTIGTTVQTVTDKGTKANDTFMTIVQTAKKLGVSVYDYIFDRMSNKFEMLSLAQLIREKSALKDEGVST